MKYITLWILEAGQGCQKNIHLFRQPVPLSGSAKRLPTVPGCVIVFSFLILQFSIANFNVTVRKNP